MVKNALARLELESGFMELHTEWILSSIQMEGKWLPGTWLWITHKCPPPFIKKRKFVGHVPNAGLCHLAEAVWMGTTVADGAGRPSVLRGGDGKLGEVTPGACSPERRLRLKSADLYIWKSSFPARIECVCVCVCVSLRISQQPPLLLCVWWMKPGKNLGTPI